MVNNFSQHKDEVIAKLNDLQTKLIKIQDKYELEFSDFIQRIKNVTDNIQSGQFTIALFGAFADGKTSIISGLLRKLEEDMEIDIEETTSEIQKYHFPGIDDIFFIDTPGLFGTKEKPIEFRGETINLGIETIKYISEAQMLIYTVDAENPLKESHFPILKWLMRDLNKIESTIFVINKMDTVADLTDDEDFEEQRLIKTGEVIKTLRNAINLKETEIATLKIVCISANPQDKGLDYWLKLSTIYENRSRINILEKLVQDFINKSKEDLMINSGISVIKDTVKETIRELNDLKDELSKNIKITINQLNEIETKINNFKRDIVKSHVLIVKEVLNIREDIISHLNNASSKTILQERLLEKIGKNGYVLQRRVDGIIEEHTNELAVTQNDLLKSIEFSINFHQNLFNNIASKYGSQVVSGFAKVLTNTPIKTLANSLKNLRDFFKIPFKFKPWQAIKFAKALAIIGTVIDGLVGIVEIWQEFKFKKEKSQIINNIEDFFKDFTDEFTTETYIEYYFPNFARMNEIFKELETFNENINSKSVDIENITTDLTRLIEKI